MKLRRNLSDEQERYVWEDMTEEELVILDILTRPAPALSADERAEVKKVARQLMGVWPATEQVLAQLPDDATQMYTLISGSELTDDCAMCDRTQSLCR